MTRFLATAIAMLWATPAFACPTCSAGIRKQVETGIFDGNFLHNLLLLAAPFPVFVGIAVVLYVSWPVEYVAAPLPMDEPSHEVTEPL